MNQDIHSADTTDLPWSPTANRVPVPDTSMLPGSELPPPAAVGMLKTAVQGAHETVDRLAVAATPAVQKLGTKVSAAAEALNLKTRQLRETGDEWADSARTTVRQHPLTSVAAAFVLGTVFVRLIRITR